MDVSEGVPTEWSKTGPEWILNGCFQSEYLWVGAPPQVVLSFHGYLSAPYGYFLVVTSALLRTCSVGIYKCHQWTGGFMHVSVLSRLCEWSTQQKHQLLTVCAHWSSFEFSGVLIGTCGFLKVLMVTQRVLTGTCKCQCVSGCQHLVVSRTKASTVYRLCSLATGACLHTNTFYLQELRSRCLEAKHINSLISFGSTGCLYRPLLEQWKTKHKWISSS